MNQVLCPRRHASNSLWFLQDVWNGTKGSIPTRPPKNLEVHLWGFPTTVLLGFQSLEAQFGIQTEVGGILNLPDKKQYTSTQDTFPPQSIFSTKLFF